MKEQGILERILRPFVLLLMLILLGTLATGCGGGSDDVACIDIVKGCSEIAKEGTFDTWVGYGEELYDDSVESMYGIQPDMIDDGAICYTGAGGVADEISVLHLKDQNDLSIVKTKLGERVEMRRNTFEGYEPKEVEKIDDSRIIVQGNFVILLITDDNDAMETEIRRIISEGKQ